MGNLFSFARDAPDDNLIVTNHFGVDVLVWVNGGGPAATVKSGTVTLTCAPALHTSPPYVLRATDLRGTMP